MINVINALIRYIARENRMRSEEKPFFFLFVSQIVSFFRFRLQIDDDLPSIPFPLCIVAEGTTNIICHSFQGNTDAHTPILHLLFGKKENFHFDVSIRCFFRLFFEDHRMKIDLSAIFDLDEHFLSANFSAAAGFPATVLKYFPRFNLHSPKTIIKKSFSKAAAKKNLQ